MNLLIKSDISHERKRKLKNLLMYFADVDSIDLKSIDWKIRFDRNNQTYRMLIGVCYLTINGLLNTLRSTEILGITPFKDFWKRNPLSVPQIPLLAKGGIVDSATLAMIGERGREAVIPLENNTEWMDVLATRINNNAPSKIVLMVDGKELGYAAINNINTITRQTGTLQLQLV
jgi:hypothetical protein